ncbi:adenylate/guanylate cyclase domain-containing protein [Leisingera methylohalidivorans]|uniref:adenylate/guanylate cyclase domain-containing protein n=1 Tax=Leisingera methylohalidivorans TaxID=133924 RepID=UPI0004155F8F|nr:adenylate/guanylate cyclase domain-containing protein [Leisingera methylohalidivorans]
MQLPLIWRAGASGEASLLRAAEVEAERIVALLRIAVSAGLLAALVLAVDAVQTVEQDYLWHQIGLAAATMLAYMAVGVLSFAAIRQGVFRRWMIWAAVTADGVFLFLNSWLSLLNSGLSGEVVFSMPATWMAPLILAFGVLRFNPLLLGYQVLLVSAGFVWLVLWEPAYISADAVQRVHLSMATPPNLMRVLMITLAGAVLIVAALRMRGLLRRSIEEARQKANLTRYLPAQLAGRLAGGGLEALREGRQQKMAILFIDIRGFTSWCEGREPQEVSGLITEFRTRVEMVAGQTGGLIDKHIGDAAMILFEGERAAARALDCAEGLLAEMEDWRQKREAAGETGLAAGIGVHWGEVFSGVTGTQARLEYSVFGDTVNTAARLEQLTKTNGMALIASSALLKEAGIEPARRGWVTLPAEHLRGRRSGLALFGKTLD